MKQTHAVFGVYGSEPFSYSCVLLSTDLERLTNIISSLTMQSYAAMHQASV